MVVSSDRNRFGIVFENASILVAAKLLRRKRAIKNLAKLKGGQIRLVRGNQNWITAGNVVSKRAFSWE